jgi:hypothetical protein
MFDDRKGVALRLAGVFNLARCGTTRPSIRERAKYKARTIG